MGPDLVTQYLFTFTIVFLFCSGNWLVYLPMVLCLLREYFFFLEQFSLREFR
jgi:hypothetical protein